MLSRSLMFRVFTASTQAQLNPSRAFQRSLHCTARLPSATNSSSKDTKTNTVPGKPANPADSTTSAPLIDKAYEDAINDIVKDTKRQRPGIRKIRIDDNSNHPKKRGRPPKYPALKNVLSTSVAPTPEWQNAEALQSKRNSSGRVKQEPPVDPRSDIKKYLQWGLSGNWSGGKAIGDRRRMNIISEDACDVILARMESSLEKHKGCDIIDINPGAGVWSKKLHDFLMPRKHILLEPDIRLCGPLLEPLVKAPGSTYQLVQKSGLVWAHLDSVLNEDHLPFQTAYPRDDPRLEELNDTLLITANLGYYPKKPYKGFSSLAQMVIYQFMRSVNGHSLFQKYGLVRMLVWINDDEKHNILPKSIGYRRKGSAEADFACERLDEVASSTTSATRRGREIDLELHGVRNVLQKMRAKGIEIPEGRESLLLKQLFDIPDWETRSEFRIERQLFQAEFNTLLEKRSAGTEVDVNRYNWLRLLLGNDGKQQRRVMELCDEYDEIMESAKAVQDLPDSEEKDVRNAGFQARFAQWEEDLEGMSLDNSGVIRVRCEDRLAFKREKPLLMWDRREIEPLRLKPEEFYPAHPMCLFDIRPKPLTPMLKKNYPYHYDVLEYLLVSFYTVPAQSVKHGLTGLVPGALEWIEAECPSLKDVRKGGNPDLDRLPVRSLSEDMLVDMVEAWLRWPFRPSKYEMLSRMGSSTHEASAPDGEELGQIDMQ